MPVRPENYDEIVARVNKKYEGDLKKGNEIENVDRISTRSLELDAAMGGGVPQGRWTRFYGGYCLAPETPVLKADYSWVPVGDVGPGTQLVAFDEFVPVVGRGQQRKMKQAEVIGNPIRKLESKRLITDRSTTVVSDGHMWLCKQSNGAVVWKRTDALKPGDRINWFAEPWGSPSDSEKAYYLAGLYDGEGWVDGSRIHFAQREGEVLARGVRYLQDLGFRITNIRQQRDSDVMDVVVGGTIAEAMEFFHKIPTLRLRRNSGDWWAGRCAMPRGKRFGTYATVMAVEDVGEQEVCAIETSSGTLMADGMFSHNSSTKTLTTYNVIAEAQSMGLTCAYYNIEKQYHPEFVEDRGVKTDELTVVEGTTVEEIGDKMEALFGVVHVHVVDSCSIAVSEDELNADLRDWRPGIGARAWGKVFRRLNERFDQHDNTVILVDQVTVNFKTGSEIAKGGKVFDHQSSMSIMFKKTSNWLYRNDQGDLDDKAKQEKGSSGQVEPAGIEIKARVEKSRVCRPFRTATMRFDLDKLEFDREWEYVKAAKHYGVVETRGSYYYIEDKKIAQGDKQLREFIRGDVSLQEEIAETVRLASTR